MHFIDPVVIGFVRVLCVILLMYYLNQRFIENPRNNTLLQFMVYNWFRYCSIGVIVVFVLVQTNAYNLFNFLLVMCAFVLLEFLNTYQYFKSPKYLRAKIAGWFQDLIKTSDRSISIRDFLKIPQRHKQYLLKPKERRIVFFLSLLLIGAAFYSRYIFYQFDIYLFSDLWVANLDKILSLDAQHWFLDDVLVRGETAVIDLYGKLSFTGAEVALQSVTVLENVLISIIIFWSIKNITFSKFSAPFIGFIALSFTYLLSPVSINYRMHSESIILSLSLYLPMMVYTLKPGILSEKPTRYFFILLIGFIGIGIIDLFTFIALIPPFYIILLLFFKFNNNSSKWLSILAYLVSAIIIFVFYYISCLIYQNDFIIFIQENLISVSSFTYFPDVVFGFDQLIIWAVICAFISILISIFFTFFKKEKWVPSIIFSSYYILITFLYFADIPMLDQDLFRYALEVYGPITIGIISANIIRILLFAFKNIYRHKNVIFVSFSVISIIGVVMFQNTILKKGEQTDRTPHEVLNAYVQIKNDFFPYSYAVVNDNRTQSVAQEKHFFINYNDFVYTYPESDSLYHAHRKETDFFKKYPELVIPPSILVFVYNNESMTQNVFVDQVEYAPLMEEQLDIYRKRNREVRVYKETPYFKIYEIINEPKASKISDLMF